MENLESLFFLCKNKEWVDKKRELISEVKKKDFYCIDIVYKYGEFNDIQVEVFDSLEEMEEYRGIDLSCESTKWFVESYYSDGVVLRCNLDL